MVDGRLSPFSVNLVRYRKRQRMSQQDLAHTLQVSQKTVSGWENITDEDDYPGYKRLRQISRQLRIPLWRLTGDVRTHDYTMQEVADWLGIDPLAVDMIRETSGFRDGEREPLLDNSRALSALLITLDEQGLLHPIEKLLTLWREPEQYDDPQAAAEAYAAAVAMADRARYEAFTALDRMLREGFPVPEPDAYLTDEAKRRRREQKRRFNAGIASCLKENPDSRRRLLETIGNLTGMMSVVADDFADAKRRIAYRSQRSDI